MTEVTPPSNFLTPNSIDNLSIAGASVWIICLVTSSLSSNIDSFWIRLIAISTSIIWSISLFIKNKKWNKTYNYIIIFVNAALIYVNAAGMNTITRQSPFEGYGIKTELPQIKTPIVKAGIFDLSDQLNWNPDYDMIKFIDSLKLIVANEKKENERYQNQFSYINDNLDNITNDKAVKANIKNMFRDFGKSRVDSSDFAIMKNEFQFRIDSIKQELKFREDHPIRISSTYTINGKKISAEELLSQNDSKITNLETKSENLINLINYIKKQKTVPVEFIDTTLKKIGY